MYKDSPNNSEVPSLKKENDKHQNTKVDPNLHNVNTTTKSYSRPVRQVRQSPLVSDYYVCRPFDF